MFLVFFLENCPFCIRAVNELKKHNLEHVVYNVTTDNKESVKTIIKHALIISNQCSEDLRKQYIIGLKQDNKQKCESAILEIDSRISKITFPQIFVCEQEFADNIKKNVFDISDNVLYIGGCDSLLKNLQT